MEGFLPGFASVRRDGRAEIGDELLKNGRGNCPYGTFLRLGDRFLCGKNGISLLKEISFLPQRRKFLAAKKFPGVWKAGKNGASGGFFFLFGDFPRAKSICPFASLSPSRADAGAVSVRMVSLGGRQSVAEPRPSAFILRFRRLARIPYFCPSPSLRPSARFSRGRF